MTLGLPDLSPGDVEALEGRTGLDLTGDAAERVAAAVNEELAGYRSLDGLGGDRDLEDEFPREITFDPGPAEDPLNAYVTTFTLERDGGGDEVGRGDGPAGDGGGPANGVDLGDLSVAIKDNMAVAGVPMTCGSRVFEAVVPSRHAAVVKRLLDAGATLAGKTNMDELAYGPTSETSGFGPVRNPADGDHVAGGSSSGSAAAVGAGEVDAALGSDTGGSVRIPASFCGVVGLKPSWGAVPRVGFVDLAYTLDHIGPLARDVETAALVLDAIAGSHPLDPSSERARRLPVGRFAAGLEDVPPMEELSLGLPEELLAGHVTAPVRERFEAIVAALEAEGARCEPVSVPTIPDTVFVWNAITNAELAATFAAGGVPMERRLAFDPAVADAMAGAIRADGQGFGPVVRRKVTTGAHLLARGHGRHYVRARAICRRLEAEFERALEGHDALLAPTMPAVAPAIGTWSPDGYSGEDAVPLAFNTRPADLAGIPALSLPAGTARGLPVGVQLMGARHDDAAVLGLGARLEGLVSAA